MANLSGNFVSMNDPSEVRPLMANRESIGTWEVFDWVDNCNGSFSLQCSNHKYVGVYQGGVPNALYCRSAHIGRNEQFYLSY